LVIGHWWFGSTNQLSEVSGGIVQAGERGYTPSRRTDELVKLTDYLFSDQ
jgi:hypothetical protein